MALPALLGFLLHPQPVQVIQYIPPPPIQVENVLGNSSNPIAGTVYTLAGSGISASASSITLTSLTIPQTGHLVLDAELSDTFYITLEPGSRTRQEVASCTTVVQNGAGTATLSGCTRGLLPFTPFTASSSYQFTHGGGTQVIFSNPPQFYNDFAAVGNSANITGDWRFPEPTNASNTATKNYADNLSFAGAPNGSTVQKGIYEEATKAEFASGTAVGSTGADLVAPNAYFNATSTATTTGVVTRPDGDIDSNFLAFDEAWTRVATTTFASGTVFSASALFSSTVTHTATTTFASSVLGAAQVFGDGSDGNVTVSVSSTLTTDMNYNNLTVNSGVVLNTGGYKIFVLNTLTNSGTIQNNGGDAGSPSATSSGAGGAAGTLRGGAAGGTGGDANSGRGGGGGGGGGWVFISARTINNSAGTIRANGGAGAAGTGNAGASSDAGDAGTAMNYGLGGKGGAGGTSPDQGVATAAGAVTTSTMNVHVPAIAVNGGYNPSANLATGGGSGGGGGNAGQNTNDGGGGGGGGGLVTLFFSSLTTGTEQANGGSAGAGVGTGTSGSAGLSGNVIKVQI